MEIGIAKILIFFFERKYTQLPLGVILVILGFWGLLKFDAVYFHVNGLLKAILKKEIDLDSGKPFLAGLVFSLIIFGIIFVLTYFNIGSK